MPLSAAICGVWSVRGRLGVGDANSSGVSFVPVALGVREETGDVWFVGVVFGVGRSRACSAVLLDGDKNLERVEEGVEVCLVREADGGDVDANPRDILSRNVQVSGTTINT